MPNRVVWIRRLRRAAFALLATTSMAIAVAMIWVAVSPGFVRLTPTAAFVGILALLVLPGITLGAWAWDRAVSLSHPHQRDRDDDDEPTHGSGQAGPPMPNHAPAPLGEVAARHHAGRVVPEARQPRHARQTPEESALRLL
ncbi:MAG: hypothetical protein ACTS22_08315 [Phycisphaerales bacterium]